MSMITNLPAVQAGCSRVKRYVCMSERVVRWEKRNANRRHRRALERITRRMEHDPELFENEVFDAPSLSTWDLW